MSRERRHDEYLDALAREAAVRRQRAAWRAFDRAVRQREADARLAALRARPRGTAAASARLDALDRLAVRCPDCGGWTLSCSPRTSRWHDGSPVYRPRVNGQPVRVHRCATTERHST